MTTPNTLHLTSARRFITTALLLLLFLLILSILYSSTLQTIPNGSDHYLMIDVGETQVVLNVWGTLHATGYPHYVITGAWLVSLLRLLGVSPAAAPAIVSLLWGLLALALTGLLVRRLTGHISIAVVTVLLYGLTRTVWIHNSIAEIYSFGLLLLAGLLVVALRTVAPSPPTPLPLPEEGNGRGEYHAVDEKSLSITKRFSSCDGEGFRVGMETIYPLALLGGIAVAHHRAFVMAIPALVYAMWPYLVIPRRALPRKLIICLLLGALGFLPYLYLPLRENAGAAWVYGQPNTFEGFLDQFLGREASRFIGLPSSLDALVANLQLVFGTLLTDLTLPGLLAGIIGLLIGIRQLHTRRAAIALLLLGGGAFIFHVLLYSDILSALILMMTLPLTLGWGWLMAWIWERRQRLLRPAVVLASAAFALVLFLNNYSFIRDLTNNSTGLETIALARQAPPGSTLMLAWGTRHFAVGFARDVLGELPNITLVDHGADFRRMLAEGHALVTPAYTFYNQPLSWWEARLGTAPVLTAAAPELVQISTERQYWTGELPSEENSLIVPTNARFDCAANALVVDWLALRAAERDLSVFVHVLDPAGATIAQADQLAPVFGWRPTTSFAPREIVHDIYPLENRRFATRIRYGLYQVEADGTFNNVLEQSVPVRCSP